MIKKPPRKPKPADQKVFKAVAWTGAGEGIKAMIYGGSGIGKTTLAALLPNNPVFIGVDDGGRLIKHPVTGDDLMHFPGIETFDVKSMLPDLKGKEKLVGETISRNMNTSRSLKHTGLSKSKYYRTRDTLRDKMRTSFLRVQGQNL